MKLHLAFFSFLLLLCGCQVVDNEGIKAPEIATPTPLASEEVKPSPTPDSVRFKNYNSKKAEDRGVAITPEEIKDCEIVADAAKLMIEENPGLKKTTSVKGMFCEKQMEHLYK